ncbi:class I SAM-dependent methyltransferase family protein [Streptomyces sp. 4N509B]|uniref:class I SAM-dependent methyltransferase family protein n=1 Tax=Streptomyces sp. 4N509B TaxID=3457413 RepID=UPI003FD25F9D
MNTTSNSPRSRKRPGRPKTATPTGHANHAADAGRSRAGETAPAGPAASGGLARLKWAAMRSLMHTVGRTSTGIRIGYEHGFDSGSMLDYVYANRAHGSLGVGRLVDRAYLNAVGWRAIRARGELLRRTLRAEIDRRPDTRPVRVLDLAAGPGRYLLDLAAACPDGRVRVVCRDLAAPGLAQGRAMARERGLADVVRYERGNAFDPAPPPPGEEPDVIVVSGLYELLLEDTPIRSSMARLRGLLAPGGTLVFTTQTRHPQLEFIANVLPNREGEPWRMVCRPVAVTEGWAREAGFTEVGSEHERVGLFTVTTARG